MILGVDIGNTHIVIGIIDNKGNVTDHVRMRTDRFRTSYEYAADIKQVLALKKIYAGNIDGSIISSVVPQVTLTVKSALKFLSGKEPKVLGSGLDTGLELDMNGLTCDDIAGDLIATAVAAKEEYPLPAIIIDIGTAATITVIDSKGVYVGGAIMPGPGTALDALVKGTSLLPAVDFALPEDPIAKNTADAMKSGIMYGSAGSFDGIVDKFTEELREREHNDKLTPTVIATGGMGRIIAPICRHEIKVDTMLLIKGLAIIWKRNSSN
ncbi:MAG: type III pantothenate kinase [Eubacterium sp.]|jgi:type III pantothenate kinase